MRAVLWVRGRVNNVYAFEKRTGDSEVRNFMDTSFNQDKSVVSGFRDIIERLADYGFLELSYKMYKRWKRHDDIFFELRKGDHRIGCFQYQQRILLMTHFMKHQNVEEGEYERAVMLKHRFDANPLWEDNDG
jgi:hypothetical protein